MRITTEQLKAVLGSNEILKGIDFQAQDNEFVGIIGPNGSGKSTLLRCLYRVLEPTQGAVYLDGKALSSYRYQESAKRISVVAQHNYYNFDFTVREVVMMGRAPHKKALDRDNADDYRIVRESLRKVGMQDFEDRSFSTLSGGEQQRIILARLPDSGRADQPPGHQISVPADEHCQGLGMHRHLGSTRPEHCRPLLRPSVRHQIRQGDCQRLPAGNLDPRADPAAV